ncbi:MAG: methyltransferase domain-containing protein [Actinomycetia bacterium]|nr:methyltransferase domain-containing protein [Actinomycetes bacterium]
MSEVPWEIVEHYDATEEDARIRHGFAQLELLRTQEIIRRFLPPRPLTILDVGGATGVHAAWLADDGHHVQIFDVVERHVEAAAKLTASSPTVTAEWGDGRHLPCPDDSADAALLLGPLYHLIEREDRLLALREAARVVRPGGRVFAATISRFASLFDGLDQGFLFDDEGARMIDEDLATGQHRNPTGDPRWFTTAYFHRPGEVRQECMDAGLEVLTVVGVEGLAGWLGHLAERWEVPSDREAIMRAAAITEGEESLLGLSAHVVAVTAVR